MDPDTNTFDPTAGGTPVADDTQATDNTPVAPVGDVAESVTEEVEVEETEAETEETVEEPAVPAEEPAAEVTGIAEVTEDVVEETPGAPATEDDGDDDAPASVL